MANNYFGKIFRITTFGESHGKAIGVTIDGCPAGIEISIDDINTALSLRAPGRNEYTTPRNEKDIAEIISGVFENKTTGAPITIIIYNKDQDSSKYEPIKNLLRPGHANYTYLQKYGIFDYKGGGRSSARETAARVAAGVVANKLLIKHDIKMLAFINSVYNIDLPTTEYNNLISGTNIDKYKSLVINNPVFCPDKSTSEKIQDAILTAKKQGDSLGANISFVIANCPVGLGEPVYDKLEARLAYAMLSIPATKGFEFGEGFNASRLLGSENNDEFKEPDADNKILQSNHAGGTLGGISTGMPITGRVAFKPTSSIMKAQNTVDIDGKKAKFNLPEGSRHDPCVAIRAVPIVEAMCALVIADFILLNKSSKIS